MSHDLEITADGSAAMFSVREDAWHQLGQVLSDAPRTAVQAMDACRANWSVAMRPLSLLGGVEAIESHRAVVRETDERVLGVVGRKYVPLQNADAFGWFDAVVGDGIASYETAGVLREGAVVWVMAKLAQGFEVVPGDVVHPYLLLSNAHDGSRAVQVRYTPIRVVCANTLSMASHGDNATDRPISIRHTKSINAAMAEAARVMGVAAKHTETTAAAFRAMARTQMDATAAKAYIERVVPLNDEAVNHTRTEKIRSEILDLFDGLGVGLEMPGVKGTLWAAYNAVTEFVDHKRHADRESKVARLESATFGAGYDLKRFALAEALSVIAS